MARDPYKYFRVEARELLDELGKGVLELKKGQALADGIPRLLRLAHTLKGAARVVKQREIADLTHTIEDALAPFREAAGSVQLDRIDDMVKLLDNVADRVAGLAPRPEAEGAAAARPTLEEPFRTVRADIAEMDAILDGVAEASVELASMRRHLASVERARHLADLLAVQLSAPRARDGEPARATTAKAKSLADELSALAATLERNLSEGAEHVDRELREVRDATERLRLLPADALFSSLERALRDVAQTLGKRVTFEGTGGDVRLDAHVLGVVQGALVQIVRNAVAHGIEPQNERRARGKPPEGRVSLEVVRRGRRVAFVCQDDGRGVDLDAVRQAAQRKGLLSSQTEKLGPEELLRVLFKGGLSTSGAVTEVSGRGIGLDVVREAADRLGGEVAVSTQPGKGTTVEIVVPVSLSSLEVLVVESSGMSAAIPLDAVRRTLRVAPGELARTADGESILYDGKVIPFMPLARSLAGASEAPAAARVWSAVVVQDGAALAGLGVDRLLGTANVVLRPLPELAPVSAVVAGASLDAEGNPQIVLDPEGLVMFIREAHQAGHRSPAAPAPRLPLLVIDDSLTTRMLEQSILESAGYEVDLATSGDEALLKARRRRYGLFLVDIEMPGMDGFEFLEQTRADPLLRDTPAILVTSRTSSEDRRRGEEIGARAYIMKSEFDQTELLDRIRQLVR